MPTLLHLDSSPLENSISRELTREFAKAWKGVHPEGVILYRDLAAKPPKTVDSSWVEAAFTPHASRTEAQHAALALSEELIAELQRADEYVVGVAMHNFSIPSTLKLWIDQVVRYGRTFSYDEKGVQGLLKGKKATVLAASGGVYEAGTPAGAMNFIDPYLKTVFGFIGVTEVKFVTAGGVSQVRQGVIDRQSFLNPVLETVRATATV